MREGQLSFPSVRRKKVFFFVPVMMDASQSCRKNSILIMSLMGQIWDNVGKGDNTFFISCIANIFFLIKTSQVCIQDKINKDEYYEVNN